MGSAAPVLSVPPRPDRGRPSDRLSILFRPHVRHIERAGFGTLGVFPTEVCWPILSYLDLKSLYRLSRTCRQAKSLVETLPEGEVLRRPAMSRMVDGLLDTGLSGYHAVVDIIAATRSSLCVCCPSCRKEHYVRPHPDARALHGFIFLPTLERACTVCVDHCDRRFGLISEKYVREIYDLPEPGQMQFCFPCPSTQWRFVRGQDGPSVARIYDHGIGKPRHWVSFWQVFNMAIRKCGGSLSRLNQVLADNLYKRREFAQIHQILKAVNYEVGWPTGSPEFEDINQSLRLLYAEALEEVSNKEWSASSDLDAGYQASMSKGGLFHCCGNDRVDSTWHDCYCSYFDVEDNLIHDFELMAQLHDRRAVSVAAPVLTDVNSSIPLLRCWGCFVNGRARVLYQPSSELDTLAGMPRHHEAWSTTDKWLRHMRNLLYTPAELQQHQKTCPATASVRTFMAARERRLSLSQPAALTDMHGPEYHYMNKRCLVDGGPEVSFIDTLIVLEGAEWFSDADGLDNFVFDSRQHHDI